MLGDREQREHWLEALAMERVSRLDCPVGDDVVQLEGAGQRPLERLALGERVLRYRRGEACWIAEFMGIVERVRVQVRRVDWIFAQEAAYRGVVRACPGEEQSVGARKHAVPPRVGHFGLDRGSETPVARPVKDITRGRGAQDGRLLKVEYWVAPTSGVVLGEF
jgi:hypothetical protein